MSNRKLFYGPTSPFARSVRIVLAEKGLDYEHAVRMPEPGESPASQVPTLVDGDRVLWDSDVIQDYVTRTYPSPAPQPGEQPFANVMVRREMEWHDRLTLATLQTLGTSIAVVVQICREGVALRRNEHLIRCAARVPSILDWCEEQLPSTEEGFIPGIASIADVRLACWLGFIDVRYSPLAWRSVKRPRVEAIVDRLQRRASFRALPIPTEDAV